jgi:hypothetical protein
MGFGSSITYRVTESDETIVKMIEKINNFGTIYNYGADNLH